MIKENNYKREIGVRLKLYRETLKLNQKEFASKLGIKQESLSRYESGNQSIPDEIKLKLSEDISIDWLITGKGEMFIESSNMQSYEHKENFIEETAKNDIPLLLEEPASQERIGKDMSLIKVINSDMKSKTVIQLPNELKDYEGKLIAIIQKGDDMETTIKTNSIVLCDTEGFQGQGVMEEVENIYINRAKIKDIDSDENESICNLITINDIGEEIIDINYCKTRIDARNYAVNKQNSGYNVCGNCVRRLYKNER